MKKGFSLLMGAILLIGSVCNGGTYFCSDAILSNYKDMLKDCRNGKYCLYGEAELEDRIDTEQDKYDKCMRDKERTEKFDDLYSKGSKIIVKGGDISEGIKYMEEALEYTDDEYEISMVKRILGDAYYSMADIKVQKSAYPEAIEYYKKYLKFNENHAGTLYNIGLSYIRMGEYKDGIDYLNQAKKYSYDADLDKMIDEMMTTANQLKEMTENIKNQVTNDKYNFMQGYLSDLNIYNARDALPKYKYSVTVAVIDDGVNINHPDLTNNIWVNSKEIPGNGKDDDKNGFIDDYNGWDFVYNTNGVLPNGSHGTMVAGIIAAKPNNSIGIAGITPSVKIMPLTVFDFNGNASTNSIINAIDYAIDNGANIINLSLGGNQFAYTNAYDRVFQRAYDNGVIVVIAAGNGDILTSKKTGVNTSVNKVSPVCNQPNLKNIIGVGALDKKGNISDWSHYGDCVDFYAFGEGIYTTTIKNSGDDPYEVGNGTSFSAPIVAGIIGLGYNKYGKVDPEAIHKALQNSTKGYVIDAEKYLKNLQASAGELSDAILWMNSKGLTIYSDTVNFMASNGLRRDEAAKFFVQYAKQVMGKVPNYYDSSCQFNDLNKAWSDLKDIVVESCQLGLFQGHNGKFMPTDKLTNAQAITVFMRLLDGYKDESGGHYANEYYRLAQSLGLLSGTPLNNSANFDIETTRGDVAKMLYRGWKISTLEGETTTVNADKEEKNVNKSGKLSVTVSKNNDGKLSSKKKSKLDTLTFTVSERTLLYSMSLKYFGEISLDSSVKNMWLEDEYGNAISDKVTPNNKGDIEVTIKNSSDRVIKDELNVVIVIDGEFNKGDLVGAKLVDVNSSAKDIDIENYSYNYRM